MSYHQTNETFQDILRRQWARRGVKIALGVAVAILVLLIGTCIALPSTTPAAAPAEAGPPTPTPEPTPVVRIPTPVVVIATPTPLPPRALNELVPFNQAGYYDYRFYHAWEEYQRCVDWLENKDGPPIPDQVAEGEPKPTPYPTPTPKPPDVELEQKMVANLQAEVRWLLGQYETGACYEWEQFTSMPGRTKWLLWAAGLGGDLLNRN